MILESMNGQQVKVLHQGETLIGMFRLVHGNAYVDGKPINLQRVEEIYPYLEKIPVYRTWASNDLDRIIGRLIGGRFKCLDCSKRWMQESPQAIWVYLINIWPYSQQCEECKRLIVDGWKMAKDNVSPLNLFWEGQDEARPADGSTNGATAGDMQGRQ